MSGLGFIAAAYIAYGIAAMIVFAWRPVLQASLICCFAGWLLLPVCEFPPQTLTGSGFTVEVIGIMLPSILGMTKAFVVSAVVLSLIVLKASGDIRLFKTGPLDLAMAAFCLTPLLPALAGFIPMGSALSQVLYLSVAWGGTWMIGRLTITCPKARVRLIKAVVFSGIALMPFALIEGIQGPWIYSAVYGPHPFQYEGASRYFGHRPMAFFEHGNQYGIWIAMAALAAVSLAKNTKPRQGIYLVLAVLLVVSAVFSQSVGAILLMLAGGIWSFISDRWQKIVLACATLAVVVGGPAYLSGKVPIQNWAETTPIGQKALSVLISSGRTSLGYRMRRDQMALPVIYRAPLTGYGEWDWWRAMGSHPWGLPLLLAGQFGVLSLALLTFAAFAGALRELIQRTGGALPMLVLLTGVDAWLNSYIYIPALLAAAALAHPLRKPVDDPRADAGQSVAMSDDPDPDRLLA